MDTIYDYDNEFKKIEFYGRFHPEYLPYVGKNYDKTKILLCGESNYIKESELEPDEIQLIKSTEWYTTNSGDKEKLPDENCIDWCQNRKIISSALSGKKNGDSIPRAHYNMYIKPAIVFLDIFPQIGNPWDAYTYFASMNYYQKPAVRTGKSIESTIEDNQFAAANLSRVVNVLKPETIIFLSKKSYRAFKANEPDELKELDIDACAHPTCAWWNRDNGNHGRELFKKIIKKRITIA
ncbi:hypothetical protein [Acetobacterium bakii]|uniref:Uracil-DNA glycosylase-like domain-containing protein n=1 Tax=Acetobacterium bakii TaxID=52689 RepID=A0A0L6TWH5_9FIRM|nr:hypothetical protein [Acetobacterium bakii]KNZ40613.1 hypothetical protein AKG39_16860 [Acetobacterium bakii]